MENLGVTRKSERKKDNLDIRIHAYGSIQCTYSLHLCEKIEIRERSLRNAGAAPRSCSISSSSSSSFFFLFLFFWNFTATANTASGMKVLFFPVWLFLVESYPLVWKTRGASLDGSKKERKKKDSEQKVINKIKKLTEKQHKS